MSIVHHPDFRPDRPGQKEFVMIDDQGDTLVVLDGEPSWFFECFEHIATGGLCTHCSERLRVPAVFWMPAGQEEDMFFHPDCAARFARALLRDVGELEETYGGKFSA
jgi:hypothetical protein